MARIPYIHLKSQEQIEAAAPIAERRGGTLLNLDRMLLHSPSFASGWNSFMGAVRNQLSLPARLRELAICAVAILNDASYEFSQHAPEFLKAGGSEAQLSGLQSIETGVDEGLFDEVERAVLDLTVEMTRSVIVSDATFCRMKDLLKDDGQVVELVGVVAAYNMVSRFLVALEIDLEELTVRLG